MGALTSFANTEVTAMGVEDGRIRSVTTTRGTIEAEYVVIAVGVWAPLLAEMAGAYIPLTPVVHQMADYGPVQLLRAVLARRSSTRSSATWTRSCTSARTASASRSGRTPTARSSTTRRPSPRTSRPRSRRRSSRSPRTTSTRSSRTPSSCSRRSSATRRSAQKYAINGLISLTPDGMPLLGETPEVKGLWSACAVWVKEGPAVGKSIAEWMIHGQPEIDCNQSDISRFHAHQKTRQHTKARAFEAFPKTYGIVHPAEQYLSDRPLRKTPMYEWQKAHDAEFFEVAGWERAQWYGCNAPLVEKYGVADPAERVGRPLVEPDHQRRAPRHARVGRHVRPLVVRHLRHRRRRARSTRSRRCASARWTSPSARWSTRRSCPRPGGFKSDLTIMRLGKDHLPGGHRRRPRHGRPEVVQRQRSRRTPRSWT